MNKKTCKKCNVEKELTEFKLVSSKDPTKFRPRCKKCTKESNAIYSESNKKTIYENNKTYRENNRDMVNENARISYHENKESRSIAAAATYSRNKNKIIARRKVFFEENPGKEKEYRTRASIKRAQKIENRLHSSVSVIVNRNIKNAGGNKNNLSILKFLPYTFEGLKAHLESLFEPWMNWDNYGKISKIKRTWNIDHIIPRIVLPYKSMNLYNFQICWAFANLRPLGAIENIAKSYKISKELRDETIIKINLELEQRAENNSEFKIKLIGWKLQETNKNIIEE